MDAVQVSLQSDRSAEIRDNKDVANEYRMLAPDLKKLIDGKSSKSSAENRAAGRDRKTNTTP